MGVFEFLYYLGLSVKKTYALKNRKKLPCRVISVGNITVGGTGKTPATMAIAKEARDRGFNPVILTRGYKGKTYEPRFVTKGAGPLLSASESGDEAFLMARRLHGIPIVKGGNRYEAGILALRELGDGLSEKSTVFILDDGFQHWQLHRNRDIVLIDALNPFGNRRLLPAGILREPIKALSRADSIVLTKMHESIAAETGEDSFLVKEIRKYNASVPVFFSHHELVSCRLLSGERKPLSFLADKQVFGFCALGSPESFRMTVESTGARLAGIMLFKDHYQYKEKDILKIRDEARRLSADWIVTTEKDIIKTEPYDMPDQTLILEIEFSASAGFFDTIFDHLLSGIEE